MVTKILNIDHDDSFDEIVDLLQRQGDEFILIVPKSHRVFKNISLVESLKKETDVIGKVITVVSTDPIIIENATEAGFQVIGKSRTPRASTNNEKIENKAEQTHKGYCNSFFLRVV